MVSSRQIVIPRFNSITCLKRIQLIALISTLNMHISEQKWSQRAKQQCKSVKNTQTNVQVIVYENKMLLPLSFALHERFNTFLMHMDEERKIDRCSRRRFKPNCI